MAASMAGGGLDGNKAIYFCVELSGFDVKTKASRHFVKVTPETVHIGDLIGDLIAHTTVDGYIDNIKASTQDTLPGQSSAISATVETPLSVLTDFGCRYLFISLKSNKDGAPSTSGAKTTSVFDVMMKTTRSYTSMPPAKPPSNAKLSLYNTVLKFLEDRSIGFTPIQVNSVGCKIVSTLTDALWFIDPFREVMISRAAQLPEEFNASEFVSVNDWHKHKQKKPTMKSTEMQEHVDALSELLMMPWFQNKKFVEFKSLCSKLVESMQKYLHFLKNQQERSQAVNNRTEPVRSFTDASSLQVIEGNPSASTKSEYIALKDRLVDVDNYTHICLQDLEPADRFKRRVWISNISLPFPVAHYTYHHQNFLGNLQFLWRIPKDVIDRDPLREIQILQEVKDQIPVYSTRAMRSEFINLYSKSTGTKPAILRSMYRYLTNDKSAPASTEESMIDERVASFLLQADDPDLIYDLRRNNGRPCNEKLDPFWDELQKFLDEACAVHERRQNEYLYMPFAISLSDMRSQVEARLPFGSALPSLSYLRLNFWPSNPHTRTAVCYTGRFRVKYAIQQRLLHAEHVDAGYANQQFQFMKQMAVKWREHACFMSLDDKAIVPIGEPSKPISTGARPHNRSLVTNSSKLAALDHDFHICGAVPSVLFMIEIPQDHRDSFYDGRIHVTVKDKVYEPSSALRHATETTAIVQKFRSTDQVTLDVPLLMMYTDGGPDHRSTFWTVQLAAIVTFLKLNLDMLIMARTAPMQSYKNPAERVMSLLNLALQNTALCREKMDDTAEAQMRSKTTLARLRSATQLKDPLTNSIEPVITGLKERFPRLKRKGEPVIVHSAASEVDVASISDCLQEFETCVDDLKTKADVQRYPLLQAFIKTHCRERQYVYQIKKCGQCQFCTEHPPRLGPDLFRQLHWLPDPTEGANREYREFEELYGTDTTDKDRPGLKAKPPSDKDTEHKALLVAGKVRGFVICAECGKRRVFYSGKRLTVQELTKVTRMQEEFDYVCGASLFQDGPLKDTIVVREALLCSSPMETQYYAGTTMTFASVCFFCGDTDVALTPQIQDLQAKYGIVRPICQVCLDSGKIPAVRNAVKVGPPKKKQKT